jgi:lycopene cyclase domain-containing protein
MGIVYLLLLIAGIACMLLLDHRFRLFFWHDPAVALLVTAVGTGLFLAWDIAGIIAGVFLRGEGEAATGILLAPELPLEEPVFLIFLVLCTMVIFTGTAKILHRQSGKYRQEERHS